MNIELPDELRSLSIPEFKITDKELIIINKPPSGDLIFPAIFIGLFFVMLLNGATATIGPEYLILIFCLLALIIITRLSLNKVRIDFEQKSASIKNYNPLVNAGRRFFKLPSVVGFKEVEKIYADWQFAGKNSNKYFVVLQTEAPYKFKIAIFFLEKHSILLADYLRNIIC